METLLRRFRYGGGVLLVLFAVIASTGCAPEEETGPRIPLESTNEDGGADSENPENAGDGEESGDGEKSDDGENPDDGEEAGTGEGEESSGDEGAEASGDSGESGDSAADGGNGEVFTITADDNMRFGLVLFEVDPGQRVTVVLENIGTLSKEVMGHNFVLLDLGTDPTAFATAAIAHRDNGHIPPGREDEVIVATDILGPGEKEEITFVAPDTAGDYDYICSFPGHAAAGMVGVMTVRKKAEAAPEEKAEGENGEAAAEEGAESGGDGEAGGEAGTEETNGDGNMDEENAD